MPKLVCFAHRRQRRAYTAAMSRRRPLTPQRLAEIAEEARRGPDGKALRETRCPVFVRGAAEIVEQLL